uniref:NADH-ubiquinone oxidoreductase chain 3 n=1 Tax=Daphnia laevis TaxID=42853 RepID=A0A5Q0RYX6_9CRUS|nr:NADH dehydrogenase subunit 3 [Daphnia laevis]QGA47448.1 NADH dehydrogenase subunit 3 [Daphnia laevis]
MFQLILFAPSIMLISLIVLILSLILSKKLKMNREKSSPFECGFDSNSNHRLPFSLRFFLITIIFLIFDVEIVMLFPALKSILATSDLMWNSVFSLFLLILLGGLFHEWNQGGLEWTK